MNTYPQNLIRIVTASVIGLGVLFCLALRPALATVVDGATSARPANVAVDTGGGSGVGAAAQSRAEQFAALRALAAQRGEVALIVRFEQFDTPLPELPAQAQQARMERIQAVRERLLADVSGWGKLGNVKRFRYSPHVALTVDGRVLDVLEYHPLALEVVEDELRAPALQETVPLIQVNTGAWASGWTGAGQTIAILDSGVDKSHPFLATKVVAEACYSTTNASSGSTSLCPGGQDSTAAGSGVNCTGIAGCEHGTHVAGIAAGKDPGDTGLNGVARDATLVAIQVFSRFDSATKCGSSAPCILSWSSDQMQALERVYALQSSFAIASVNMSLGGGKSTANCDGSALKPTIDNLRAVGVAVAIASGNDGYTDAISAPACISSAISVGATCDSGGGYCTGPDAVAGYSNIASFISLLAPGSIVTSSVPGGGYASWNGTSMATPHVAGAWAVKKQRSPGASVSAILDDFRSTGALLNDARSGGSVTGLPRIRFAAAQSYTLTLTNGGNGTVTSAPTGVDCGTTCVAAFAPGTTVTLAATPATSYELAGWSGACSGTGSCVVAMNANAAVTASFRLANRAPSALGDSYNGSAGSTMNITAAAGILNNDSDPDGNPLSAKPAVGPANGVVLLAADGGFTYTPKAGFTGTDSFSYQAFDGTLYSNTAVVTLNIAAVACTVPQAPTTLTAKAQAKLRIQLSWRDRASNESGFRIERSTDAGASWAVLASVGSGVTTHTDGNLAAGKKYSYRVKAWNGCGESATTNAATATAKN